MNTTKSPRLSWKGSGGYDRQFSEPPTFTLRLGTTKLAVAQQHREGGWFWYTLNGSPPINTSASSKTLAAVKAEALATVKAALARLARTKPEWLNAVFDLLVEIGGAHDSLRAEFLQLLGNAERPCDEFRFQGTLGFGGKYRRKTNTVDFFPEDLTPARVATLVRLNKKLAKLPNAPTEGE
jgi:hypothetical protein